MSWGRNPWEDIPEELQDVLHEAATVEHPVDLFAAKDILRRITEYVWEKHKCEATPHELDDQPEPCEKLAQVGRSYCEDH